MKLVMPIRTISESNDRSHWAVKAKRVAKQRGDIALIAMPYFAQLAGWQHDVPGLVITLTRIAPRELDDDNLRGALKACRDEIAWSIGLPVKNAKKRIADDRDPRVKWDYGQRKGKPKQYAVEVSIVASNEERG